MIETILGLAVVLATWPLSAWGLRCARRYRKRAAALAGLLLLFGVNVQVTPPPPPRVEHTEAEAEEAADDEPK